MSNTPLNADPNLRRTVNQMLDFFTEPDTGEKYLKDLENEIVELVKKHELQSRIDENRRAGAWWGGLADGEKLRIGMDYMHNRDKELYDEL